MPWLAAMTFWRAVAGTSVVSVLASKESTMAAPALQMA